MTTSLQVAIKYCKSLEAPMNSAWTALTAPQASRFFHKLLYEWWGFVVNGGTSLTVPNNVSASFPSGFTDQVLASGADGFTTFGSDVFASNSTNFQTIFTGSLIGKYLVAWIPGSPGLAATDDGVYQIKAVEDANHIRVDVSSAGTRRLGNHPWFWDRTNINWRVVDIWGTAQLPGYADGDYQILTFATAPIVNPGQATSQVQVFHKAPGGNVGGVGLVISPSGSWSGTSFSDGTAEQDVTFFNLSGSGTAGQVTYTLIGSTDFIIAEVRGPNPQGGTFTAGSGFHVEIPQRQYPAANDPNPVAWVLWQNATPSQVASTYYNGWNMVGRDGTVRSWTTLVRSPMGDRVRFEYTNSSYGNGQWQQFQLPAFRFADIAFDRVGDLYQHNVQYMTTDGQLSETNTPNQFSLARARLRRVRFTVATLPRGFRVGDPVTDPNGWVVVSNGVLWPWDNSILPEGPWRFGV